MKVGGIVCLLLLASSVVSAGELHDYLSPEQRARVEKLKVDVDQLATGAGNRVYRAELLWAWANAYAITGGELPVNLTQVIAAVLRTADPAPRLLATLDAQINELALLDDHPGALGSLEADLGPFTARSYVTFQQRYTVGDKPIQTGGGFLIARHFMPNYGRWQTEEPASDNYISISSTNANVSFATDSFSMTGMHGGFRSAAPTLVFRVATGKLQQGDVVTITYGDSSQGSRGLLMADFSSDRMPFPIYLAFEDGGHFFTLPIQPIVVVGTQIARVKGFAPSVVATDEVFTLSVRAEDKFFNRATGPLPSWRISLDGRRITDIPADSSAITIVKNVRLPKPGIYRFEIRSGDGGIVGTSNPVVSETNPTRRIFWGDSHAHSGFAEGIGTPTRFMNWARDDARLDWVAHSEHDIWTDDNEWEVLRKHVKDYTEDGEFIAFLSYEWTVNNLSGGHHNVLYRTPDNRQRVTSHFAPTLSKLYQGLRTQAEPRDVVVIPHAHQAGDYRLNDPELEPLVEIMSQHGTFEWFGRMYLNHGHQVGFTAASDNHLSQPGYTAPLGGSLSQRGGLGAILAQEKSIDGIFDGMKALSSYATTGERIILDVTLNDHAMGQRAPFADVRHITGRVIGTAPLDTITLIKNDEEIWQQDYLADAADKLNREDTFLLSFASDSKPIHAGDNPRGWRAWHGTLSIVNATLESAEGTDFHSHAVQSLEVDAEDPNTVHFRTQSRGDSTSLKLRLSGLKRTSEFTIKLQPGRETGGAPPVYRPKQTSDAAELTFSIRDLERGQAVQTLTVDDYTDRVTLRRVIKNGVMQTPFEFTDESTGQGDYYYVRVKQADDAMAWSSPIWVGGHPKR